MTDAAAEPQPVDRPDTDLAEVSGSDADATKRDAVEVEVAPDAEPDVDVDFIPATSDPLAAFGAALDASDAIGDATAAAPQTAPVSPPQILAMWVDTANTLLADRVTEADDGIGPGDGPDLVFNAIVVGSIDALILTSVGDAQGISLGTAANVWDTLVAGQSFPQVLNSKYQQGGQTPILGVTEQGGALVNLPDGSIRPLLPGTHSVSVFANVRPYAVPSGSYFRLIGVSGQDLIYGPPVALSFGAAISSMSAAPNSRLDDLVSQTDDLSGPGGFADFAFDIDVMGPLDDLILTALVLPPTYSSQYIWDTIMGSRPFPADIALAPGYNQGSDTWVLGITDASGAFINNTDGSIPRIEGHFSGRIFATGTFEPYPTEYVFQLVGLIGDQRVRGPLVILYNN